MARNVIPELETPRLLVTIPAPDAASRMAAYYAENQLHHGPWDPPHPDGFFTEAYWAERLARHRSEFADDQAVRLAIFRRGEAGGPVVGQANLTQIVRGPFQACNLGYSVDHRCEGQGFMTEALRAVIEYAFGPMALHRIQANYRPSNERSGRLLRRLGFVVEGYARDYLFINGAWRDHILTALTQTP